jgi:hypothetical protein
MECVGCAYLKSFGWISRKDGTREPFIQSIVYSPDDTFFPMVMCVLDLDHPKHIDSPGTGCERRDGTPEAYARIKRQDGRLVALQGVDTESLRQ